jgi:hypothetical protein
MVAASCALSGMVTRQSPGEPLRGTSGYAHEPDHRFRHPLRLRQKRRMAGTVDA